jgi:hypothetical protein
MVARLLRCSVSLAQKPKSAGKGSAWRLDSANGRRLTNFHVTAAIKQDIVALDISVYDVLVMQMLQTFASLIDR